jgi:hypothetical protein
LHFAFAVALDRMSLIVRTTPESDVLKRVLATHRSRKDVVFFKKVARLAALACSWVAVGTLKLISLPDKAAGFGFGGGCGCQP